MQNDDFRQNWTVYMAKIDVTDHCLIALLQADGRLQHTDLARRLGIPEATVRRRMKRLLDERVMQIVAVPDPYKIGYDTHAIVGLRVQPGKIGDVIAVLDPLPEIRYIGVTAGTYDVVVEALFENNDELRHFLTDTLGRHRWLARDGDIVCPGGGETGLLRRCRRRTLRRNCYSGRPGDPGTVRSGARGDRARASSQ